MTYSSIPPKNRPHIVAMSAAILSLALLAACSTTSNLPEDEQLYIGIDKITYDGTPEKKKNTTGKDSVGVITSIGEAVNAVGDLLNGKGTDAIEKQLTGPSQEPDKEKRKRIKAQAEADRKAFETAREEVEAVLAYPPNNSLFGSSSLRSPFPVGDRKSVV